MGPSSSGAPDSSQGCHRGAVCSGGMSRVHQDEVHFLVTRQLEEHHVYWYLIFPSINHLSSRGPSMLR